LWTASLHNGRALMGGKARVELSGRFGGEVVLGSGCDGGGAGRLRDGGGGAKAKALLLCLVGTNSWVFSPKARYSLNASSGGMQQHQLECVSR